MEYVGSTGGSAGQVIEVDQTGGTNPAYNVNTSSGTNGTPGKGVAGYTTTYTYNAFGDRATSTYVTADGLVTWQYGDYVEVGTADKPNRVFQTLTKLSGGVGSNPTAEEMDYQYDSRGRLTGATFAQTPYTGFTPGGSSPWYDANHPAQTRARAYYTYDAAGRMINCDHYWDSLVPGTTSYGTSSEIIGNDSVYDAVLGLKTSSATVDNSVSPTDPSYLGRTETYTYDSQLDYLTSANYGDGLANANPSWTYDAAANRTDSVCDNLNRTTSIGGTAVTTDILGNRLVYGSSTYSWDALNRMTSLAKSGTTTNYEYRADGMRTHKSSSSTNFTEYFHDAQMSMEDSAVNGSNLTVTRYGLGARGIDYEEVAEARNDAEQDKC